MPKILRIINRFNLGGPTFNAAYLTRYLNDDYETLLVGGSHEESEDSSKHIVEELGLEPRILQTMKREVSPWNDRKAYRELKQIIREYEPDIVHTHASKAGAIGRLAAAELKVPGVVHTFHGHVFHSYFNRFKTEFYRRTEKYLASKSSRIVAISDKQKEELANTYRICNENKIEVIPLGFDLDRFREDKDLKRAVFRKEFELSEDTLAIGVIGRLVPIKNHRLFIHAASELKKRLPGKSLRFFIIGDGELLGELQNFTEECGLRWSYKNTDQDADIQFTSWRRDTDVVFAGMDIIALTSLNEGTPVTLIEAQAAGKPIVSTNVGGISNVVLEGKTALLSQSEDLEAISHNLTKLCSNPRLRSDLSYSGWDHVKERFHYQRLVSDMDRLYRTLLN